MNSFVSFNKINRLKMDLPSSSQAPKVSLFRARNKPTNTSAIRKREKTPVEQKAKKTNDESGDEGKGGSSDSSDSSSSTEPAQLMRLTEKRKQLRGRNLIHTTSKKHRKAIDALAEEEESSSSDAKDGAKEEKFDPDVKFASSGQQRMGPSDMGATARREVDTDYSRDSQSQFERIQTKLRKEREDREKQEAEEEEDRKKYGERAKMSKLKQQEPSSSQPKIYHGMAVYGAREREDTIKGNATSGLNRLGPIRATQYMRASVRWDYAPDICKDYKETGFCTFGDSCKFMHDRTDYKHGWEIERDWEAGKLKESKDDEYLISSEEGEDEEGHLPHSCFICREHFKQPVVTKCKHYFCEECALKHYQKSKKCAVCGEKTEGVFNVAREILAKLKERDEAKAKRADEEDLLEDEEKEVEAKTLPMAEEEDKNESLNEEDDEQ